MRTFCPFPQVGSFDQHLPGGQTHQRDGRGVFHAESLWLDRHGIFTHRYEFRESADAIFLGPRIDLVAGLESRTLNPTRTTTQPTHCPE